jgi:hypothetical protein
MRCSLGSGQMGIPPDSPAAPLPSLGRPYSIASGRLTADAHNRDGSGAGTSLGVRSRGHAKVGFGPETRGLSVDPSDCLVPRLCSAAIATASPRVSQWSSDEFCARGGRASARSEIGAGDGRGPRRRCATHAPDHSGRHREVIPTAVPSRSWTSRSQLTNPPRPRSPTRRFARRASATARARGRHGARIGMFHVEHREAFTRGRQGWWPARPMGTSGGQRVGRVAWLRTTADRGATFQGLTAAGRLAYAASNGDWPRRPGAAWQLRRRTDGSAIGGSSPSGRREPRLQRGTSRIQRRRVRLWPRRRGGQWIAGRAPPGCSAPARAEQNGCGSWANPGGGAGPVGVCIGVDTSRRAG